MEIQSPVLTEEKSLTNYYKGTVLEFFSTQATLRPDQIAVKMGDRLLTYKELDEKSHKLAIYLLELGIGRDSLVTILLPRSPEMIVSILGVLKAGGAYIPLGPKDGADRVVHILEDSKAPVLITQEQYMLGYNNDFKNSILDVNIKEKDENWINLIKVGPSIDNKSLYNYPVKIDPSSLVYLIYTSGTTGKPKGAMIEHRNLYTYIKNFRPTINYNDRTLHSMNPACDSSIGEIFPTLCNGGTLVLWQENLSSTIREEKITYTTLTPSMAELIDPADCLYLKKLILGGEKLTPEVVRRFPKQIALYNGYGPTEGTVDASITRIYDAENIHIGDRLPHVELHVVNAHGEICPIGEPGELWIGGGGIGRGYLNRPELTKEKFIPNPFGEGILYKTGDLVCWHSEGYLDFLGRIDRQVKVRGFRVELDGLEKVICSFSGVTGSYVVFKNKNLIAYLTPENINLTDLKKFLEKELPSYSIPSKFFNLEKFPINSAGKVDEKSLPEVSISSLDKTNLPETEFQKKMAEIWRNVIEPKSSEKEFPISLDDNFFDLGGNSLDSLMLTKIIQKKIDPKFSIDLVYSNPTFSKLVKAMETLSINSESKDEERAPWHEILLDGIKSFVPTTFFYLKIFEPLVFLVIFVICFPFWALIFVISEFLFYRFFKFPNFEIFRKIDLFVSGVHRKYNSVKIIEEFPIEKMSRTAFMVNPHGMTEHHIRPVEQLLFKKGIKFKNTHHDTYFKIPLSKTWYQLHMGISAEEKSYIWAEKENYNLVVALGDEDALRMDTPGVVVQSNQKVFFKYILQTGTSLTPVYVHGNHKAFKAFNHFFKWRLDWYKKYNGQVIQPFWGRWLLCIPFKVDLLITFGTPLEVKKIEKPTWDEVEDLYSRFMNHLNDLYKKYAPADGPKELTFY